jgi:5-methylcytosine-specific restriction endonuclease McrA
LSKKKEWKDKFVEKAGTVHKRSLNRFADRMLKRTSSWKSSLSTRSKKNDVECLVTLDELRQLMYDAYGTKCRYCHKTLDINNLVIDHITPISKKGTSNIDNLQVICKTSNSMKGSLNEDDFGILLEWLDSAPEQLSKDISIRLSRGIH